MNKELFELIAVNRDAVAVNRGYYYQYLCVLKKWLATYISGEDKIIFTEVGDDIKEVGDKLVYTQIKCYSSTFNLRSKEVRKAIFNFFVLFLQERSDIPEIKFVFQTNTVIATNERLLRKWIENQSNISGDLKGLCVSKIKEILLTEIKRSRDARLHATTISLDNKERIKTAYDKLKHQVEQPLLQDFVGCISWDFLAQPPELAIHTLYHQIRLNLQNQIFQNKPEDILLDTLLSEIYRRSQEKDANNRFVDNKLLNAILDTKDQELKPYINRKLIDLLGVRYSAIQKAVEELQRSQIVQDQKFENLRQDFEKTRILSINIPKALNSIPSIYSNDILGASAQLQQIDELLNERPHLLITGTGGMGKSTLAKTYLSQHQDAYDHLVWVNGESDLSKALVFDQRLRKHLSIVNNIDDSLEMQFNNLLGSLDNIAGRNIIVIDDLKEDFNVLAKLRELRNWQVLVTSRNRWENIPNYVIKKLDFEAAKHLYLRQEKSKPATDESLKIFFERIEYNTLIIELVAKTINNSIDIDLDVFIKYLENQELDNEDLQIDIQFGNEEQTSRFLPLLQQTFNLSGLDEVEKFHLEFFSLLPSEDTQIDDLVEWCGKADEKANKISFANIINRLQKKGWVVRSGNSLSMHRMLQESIIYEARKGLNPFISQMFNLSWLIHRFMEGVANDAAKAIRFLKYGESILNAVKEPYRHTHYQSYLILENEVLHVQSWLTAKSNLLSRWENLTKKVEDYPLANHELMGTIYNNYGLAFAREHIPIDAITYFNKAISIFKGLGKPAASKLLYAYNNLSMLYAETGEFQNFKIVFNEAMKFRKEHKFYKDPSVPLQANLLGIANQNLGNYSVAIKMFELAIEEHLLLEKKQRNDLNLVFYLNNLAYNLFLSGEKEKASSFISKAIQQLEKIDVKNNGLLIIIIRTLIFMLEESGDNVNLIKLKDSLNMLLEERV